MKSKKVLYLAKLFELLGLSKLLFNLTGIFFRPYIRIINYHKTPIKYKKNFEKQLINLLEKYQPINKEDLINFLENKEYNYKKPGIIFTFDDGFKSNYEILPLLEKYKITGFFFISPNLVGEKEKENYLFSKEQYMKWSELKKLSEKHIIGSHTLNHVRMHSNLSEDIISEEIVESKRKLETQLEKEIDIFCWVGGEENSYYPLAEKIIQKNYKYVFRTNCMVTTKKTDNYLLERNNIEVNYPDYLVDFYLCGFMDLIYFFKRRRLAKELKKFKQKIVL